MQIATIEKNQIQVTPKIREDDGTKWLNINVPNGWDDVKKLSNKVLTYNGETYSFRGWNSDRNECFFKQNNNIATVK